MNKVYDVVKVTCRGSRREIIKRGIRSHNAAWAYAAACEEDIIEQCSSSLEHSPVAVYGCEPDIRFDIVERTI